MEKFPNVHCFERVILPPTSGVHRLEIDLDQLDL